MAPPHEKRPSTHWLQGLGGAQRYMGLGLQAGATVAFYVGGGLLLDRWLGSMPWLTLTGSIVGLVALFALFFRVNAQLTREHNEREKTPRPS